MTARADFSPGAIDPLSRVRAPALDAGICEIRERAAERPGFASLWGPRTRRFDRSKRWRLTLRQKVPPGPAGLHRPRIYQWSARRARRAEFEKLHRSLRHGCGSRRCYGNRILERQDKIVSIAGIGAQAERARIGAALPLSRWASPANAVRRARPIARLALPLVSVLTESSAHAALAALRSRGSTRSATLPKPPPSTTPTPRITASVIPAKALSKIRRACFFVTPRFAALRSISPWCSFNHSFSKGRE